jgi:inosose dehydratase
MNQRIKWGYGVNQWKAGFTSFARLEEIERALKVTAACGFDAVELNAGSGRWDPIGRPENVAINYGSAAHFRLKLKELGIHRVASTFFDPTLMSFEDLHFGLMSTQPGDRARIVAQARLHAEMLAELGGEVLVVRPFPSFWKEGALDEARMAAAAACWNEVGAMAASLGLVVGLHVDALSALRSVKELERLMELCDRGNVGLVLDTAELTIAGHDVVALYRRFHDRVVHFHFKDALAVDTLGEYRLPNAERAMIAAGGEREVQRWFGEMGTGLVDFPALLAAMREMGYAGWVIVESDKGPEPIASGMMLNAWYRRNVLEPLAAGTLD